MKLVEIIRVRCKRCGHMWNWQEPKTGFGWDIYAKEWNVTMKIAMFIHRTARLKCKVCGAIADVDAVNDYEKVIVDNVRKDYRDIERYLDDETMSIYIKFSETVPMQ